MLSKQAKKIIEERYNKIGEEDSNFLILVWPMVENILKMFLEHPTKPGYKRQDIEYFLNLNKR